jgi:hypothetical protein
MCAGSAEQGGRMEYDNDSAGEPKVHDRNAINTFRYDDVRRENQPVLTLEYFGGCWLAVELFGS